MFGGKIPRKPHIYSERLRRLCHPHLHLLDDAGTLRLLGRRGCDFVGGTWGSIAAELVGHADEEAFRGEAVGLQLVVDAVDAGAAC